MNAKISDEVADLDGYRPMPVNQDAQFRAVKVKGQFEFDETCKHYLDKIVSDCKEKNIRLLMTSSPSLAVDFGNFLPEMEAYCQRHSVDFLSWNGDTAYTNHSELFYDRTHLNADGAKLFTKDFLRRIKDKI